MERILWLYRLPFDAQRRVVCFDERPCFLIRELAEGLGAKSGAIAKEHYAYQKNDLCALLATIEPSTGNRIADVFDQRRKIEFARHLQKVAAHYPEAEKITMILDNLNTQHASSFYEAFPAADAFALAHRFEFVYTPKSASWLNMIEIEFSAIETARTKLNRHYQAVNVENEQYQKT